MRTNNQVVLIALKHLSFLIVGLIFFIILVLGIIVTNGWLAVIAFIVTIFGSLYTYSKDEF